MQTKQVVYSAYKDGTHAHHRADGIEYCTQEHRKPLSTIVKVGIVSGWLVAVIAIAHLILISQGL
jgi:hypothetical protein